MLANCPVYYETSRVFKAVLQAIGPELDTIRPGVVEVLDQFFVPTATWGLDTWEKDLGLSSYTGKPDDQRRSRIISKMRGFGTVNVKLIKSIAEAYSNSTCDITKHPDIDSVTIKFVDTLGIPPNLDDLKAAINEVLPAHIVVTYEFTYTVWSQVKKLTWEAVKTSTWGELKTRVIN